MAFSDRDFDACIARLPVSVDGDAALAVGVSGGPDSMALCHMLSVWAGARGVRVHAVTVDHGLRAEAAEEAAMVGRAVSQWPQVSHVVLRWEGDKPDTRILEEARQARYDLIETYLEKHGIAHVFTAHHQDDQAETFLIRLAKGSGLDGLAAMMPVQEKRSGIIVCRPLLTCPKEDLIAYCEARNIPFVNDPTNADAHYLRPRLRAARAILEEEGLSSKRLAVTAQRLARARQALETLSEDLFARAMTARGEDKVALDWNILSAAPEELILRVLLRCVDLLNPARDYAPRMERMEQLLDRLLWEETFKSATLGGCLFARNHKNHLLTIEKENI